MRGMWPFRRKGSWYMPGRLYDLAFARALKGLRRRVSGIVEREGLYPWLDICCGTGSQFRGLAMGRGDDRNGRGERAGSRPVFGLDRSEGMVRYAATRAHNCAFICGDAGQLPFKEGSLRAVSVSLGLHDKHPDLRRAMMAEARRVLVPGGRLIAVDFENPWSAGSRLAALAVWAIERLAVGEHYRNGRDFLNRGGLRAFLRETGFAEVARHDIESGSISVVVASPR